VNEDKTALDYATKHNLKNVIKKLSNSNEVQHICKKRKVYFLLKLINYFI